MRNRRRAILFTLSITLIIALNSCEEVGPAINLTDDTSVDTSYITDQVENPQDKIVVLEEYTGVRCVNCPRGHELIDNIALVHPLKFIAVSEHSEFLAVPYPGDQDLRAEEAQELENLLGPANGKPIGSIDRKLFSGEDEILISTTKWAGYVDQQIGVLSPVNIHLEIDYDHNNRILNTTVKLHYTSEVLEENKLTVMILEDGIITKRLGDTGIDSNYVQNQVLRTTLTAFNGVVINTTKERGRVVVKTFMLEEVPLLWDDNQLRVVALVHKSVGSLDILQAGEADVKP